MKNCSITLLGVYKKISNLTFHEFPNNINTNKTNWIEYICDSKIPNDVVASLGEKFSLSINKEKDLPLTEYIACIESAISDQQTEINESISKIKLRHNNNKICK